MVAATETAGPPVTLDKEQPVTQDACASPQHFVAMSSGKKCCFCGYNYHDGEHCPAQNSSYNKCGKRGHFMKVCKSKPSYQISAALS